MDGLPVEQRCETKQHFSKVKCWLLVQSLQLFDEVEALFLCYVVSGVIFHTDPVNLQATVQ